MLRLVHLAPHGHPITNTEPHAGLHGERSGPLQALIPGSDLHCEWLARRRLACLQLFTLHGPISWHHPGFCQTSDPQRALNSAELYASSANSLETGRLGLQSGCCQTTSPAPGLGRCCKPSSARCISGLEIRLYKTFVLYPP